MLNRFTKKAAMFGLDARIALAIFGALSVISGAALYSAIEKAKNTQFLVEMSEISKAIEAYVLDVGSLPALHTSYIFDAEELVDSSANGWQGPYLSKKIVNFGAVCNTCVLDLSKFNHTSMGVLAISGYEENGANSHGLSDCTSGSNCQIWLMFGYVSDTQAKKWDEAIDGAVSVKTGNFRVQVGSDPKNSYSFYKTGINIDQLK